MTFTDEMKTELAKPLDPAHVKPPPQGKFGEYIDGFHSITEANRIFGFDGWSYSITMLEQCARCEATDKKNDPQVRVGYRCTVRVNVDGVEREGAAVGTGMARPENEADAHESAVKEAETDALKRALRSYGYPLGLALYDKTKATVCAPPPETITDGQRDQIAAVAKAANTELGAICKSYNIASLKDLPADKYQHCLNRLNATIEKNNPEKQKEPENA